MKQKKVIRRGSIYYADMEPVRGSEQGGYRPVLILQNDIGNDYSPTIIIAAITSRVKSKLPTHVKLKDMKGLEKDSVVLLEQIRTIDKSRLDEKIGYLNRYQMRKVDEALRISVGMKKMDKPIFMTLCPLCAKPFYDSDEHYIKRADLHQKIKGDCMFCNVRTGYDYLIRKKY